jgi:rhamnogalacturonan endolyase
VSDNETYLGIYTSNYTTSYPIPTLMHDHTYRMAICWQNTAYNQPPHLGYNLAEAMLPALYDADTNMALDANTEIEVSRGSAFEFTAPMRNAKSALLYTTILPDGTKKTLVVPEGFAFAKADDNKSLTLSGTPTQEGDYVFTFRLTGLNNEIIYQTLTVHVQTATGISILQTETADTRTIIYDAAGHQLPYSNVQSLPKGIYLVQTETANGVMTRKIIK